MARARPAALAATRRLGAGRRLRLGRHGAVGADAHADELLDRAQERPLVAGAERDRDAGGAGPRRAADAVDVLLGHVGQVVVDDVADPGDVDAAGGDVGGDEMGDPAGAERGEGALALALALVAVDRLGGDAGLLEVADDPVGAVLGAGEDQRPLDALAA